MNQSETNPHLKRLDELEQAKTKWAYSEWLLSFLRSEGTEQPKILTDEELLQWAQNLH
jgi:hypothetical protein